jgi:outer membrane protein assembly factor BamB
LITAAKTVIVPVKTGANTFRVEAHTGTTGKGLWTQNTSYLSPSASFVLGLGPPFWQSAFVPDVAGRVLVRTNPNSAKGTVAHLYFYGQKNYLADPQTYQRSVLINTPLSIDAHGNLFFGFVVLGSAPIGFESGLARVAPDGKGTWVSAAAISGDSAITKVAMSCAPALSNDGSTLYVAVDNQDFGYGYLIALDSTTLEVINHIRLSDPSSGLDAIFTDASSATPTVGPDGDVYFGVLENPFPSHNDRGWLLHFNSDLVKAEDSWQLWLGPYCFDRRRVPGTQLSRQVKVSADDEVQQLCWDQHG